nr:hypothetical protein [Tanacetum cinerariifolium]
MVDVTIIKKSQDLKNFFYHKLYDILKQHQNEVNEIKAERLTYTTNRLAPVAQQQPVYQCQPNPTHYSQNSSTRSQAATRNKGKVIFNSSPPSYDLEPKAVADDDASSKEKEIDKLMDLILMYFKKIYKPTNNNLRTSSNTRNTNVDNTPRSNKGTGGRRPKQKGKIEAFASKTPRNVGPDEFDISYTGSPTGSNEGRKHIRRSSFRCKQEA